MEFPVEEFDYFVYLMELPPGIYAMLVMNDDATYSLYFDPRRDFESRLNDWEHEMLHLLNDDFYNGKPICVIENK